MNARDGFRNGIEMMQQSARLMRFFTPGRGVFCDWQELDDKIESFRLFQYAERELGRHGDHLPHAAGLPIDELVRRALALDAFRAIWVLEGIGHLKATAHSLSAKGLLTEGPAAWLSDRAMVPLHAGMGMAFAEKLFAMLDSTPSPAAIRQTVQCFLDACRANCRPGWEDACMEPIGLVVRCLYPSLLTPVSEAMEASNPALRRLFWHGVGRSLYFVPTNFLPIPGAHDRMFSGALSETNDPADRRNVIAGLVWAITLVNLCKPEILRQAMLACSNLQVREQFSNGVISALLAWHHMAPGDVRYLGDYTRPDQSNRAQAAVWTSWVADPSRDALRNIYPGLERRNNIPALYTCRTSEELGALSAPESEITT